MKLKVIIFVAGLICILFFLRTNSTEKIPFEDEESKKKLIKIVSLSKVDTMLAILELEKLKDSGNYTEYKKNYILGRLYEKNNNNKEARLIYEKIINQNYPLKERVIFHLANLNAKEGNNKTALKLYNKLLHDFPYSKSVPQTKYYLAQTIFRLKLTKEALNTLMSLKNEFPDTQYGIATNYYLGEYEYNNNNYNEALKYWREYLKLSPDGRFANEIKEAFTKGNLSLLPSDYSLLGDVFYHKKDYKNSSHFYKIENNHKKYYELGYSLFRINKNNEAKRFLKEFAYAFPKSKNAKFALLYASKCLPFYEQKAFFVQATKDIPDLSYYTIYKQATLEKDKYKKEKILKDYLEKYTDNEFTLDAVWEIVWQKIQYKEYEDAKDFGKKYFNLSRNTKNSKSEGRARLGFWLGKLEEITGNTDKAVNLYTECENITFDNYYSLRSKNRLISLNTNLIDILWSQNSKLTGFNEYIWVIPQIIDSGTLRKFFGSTVSELINLKQYDEAIELIGKSKFPSKRITAWLQALNSEYESSINLSNTISNLYSLNKNNPLWNLAYPLHFWEYISDTCKKYPNIDPLLICSVIRQESRFDKNALSISDAYGLMQLIPSTAKVVARRLRINLHSLELLKEPKTNIALGIDYLDNLLKDFQNPLFAVASYNAGPNAVKSWIRKFNKKDLDFFIEEIPYDQTKNYVKKVFASYWTYHLLYTK